MNFSAFKSVGDAYKSVLVEEKKASLPKQEPLVEEKKESDKPAEKAE